MHCCATLAGVRKSIKLHFLQIFRNNHEKFSLKVPNYSTCDEIEKDLKSYEDNWSLFSNFISSLEDLGQEEWIVIRSRSVQKLEDFLAEWTTVLNSRATSPLTVKLNKEIEKYKSVIPCLKYVRGETFSDKHWLEFFSIVEAPYKPIELITFKDILSVKSKILVSYYCWDILTVHLPTCIVCFYISFESRLRQTVTYITKT